MSQHWEGDGDVAIVPMPRKVALGSRGFSAEVAPVPFVPRLDFILNSVAFEVRKRESTVLQVSWAGNGRRDSHQREPLLRGAEEPNS